MDLISAKEKTATKQLKHNCFACNLPILKGDKYVSTTYRDDGIYSLNEHLECTSALLPECIDQYEELPYSYLVEYFDTPFDTTEEWQKWYRDRVEFLKFNINKKEAG
jgi:hypothetical protein